MTTSTKPSSDDAYRQAGVDLNRAEEVVHIAKAAAQKTASTQGTPSLGGFSSITEIPPGYKQPVILTACDGVGTKLKLAVTANRHQTVGIDLVAMSVNDILVNGGKPMLFLDYLATSQIAGDQIKDILEGIAEGCTQAGCQLVGGETAEMPGFYQPKEYDLAGFCVGIAEKDDLYPKSNAVQDGDVVIGLTSAGLHSNGYSLVRKLLDDNHVPLDSTPDGLEEPLIDALLRPTRIYVKPVLTLLEKLPNAVRAMAHITGGGFYDNIPRVLPEGFSATLHSAKWKDHIPLIFSYLQQLGNLSDETMWHTFNSGIGYVLVVNPKDQEAVINALNTSGAEFTALVIGSINATPDQKPGEKKVTIE